MVSPPPEYTARILASPNDTDILSDLYALISPFLMYYVENNYMDLSIEGVRPTVGAK